MPAPLDVDRDAVKAHAILHGVRQAARDFGIDENTVKQWSRREGWLRDAGVAIVPQPLPASMAPRIVPNVPKASVAAKTRLASLGDKSRLNLAKYVEKGSRRAAKLKGDALLDQATAVKAIADVGKTAFSWDSNTTTPTLRLELVASASQDDPPTMDNHIIIERVQSHEGASESEPPIA